MIAHTCQTCGKIFNSRLSEFKIRGRKYCSRVCNHQWMRIPKHIQVETKRLYDIAYREKNREMLKAKKRARYLKFREKLLVKFAEYRNTHKPQMAEYKRQYYAEPENKMHKKDYDRKRRCKLQYGEFAEAAYVTLCIEDEVVKRVSKHEIRMANGTINKAQQRSRNAKVKRQYT